MSNSNTCSSNRKPNKTKNSVGKSLLLKDKHGAQDKVRNISRHPSIS